jgi:hypothetical protein
MMKKTYVSVMAIIVSALTVFLFTVLGSGKISPGSVKQSTNGVSPHTVIYRVQEYAKKTLKPERIVSRSVNEKGEWYEENLYPNNGKSVAVLEDGHYLINQQNNEKVQYKSSTSHMDCADFAEKVMANAKETIKIAGLTAYVVGGQVDEGSGLSYEKAYARETGCTPLKATIKSKDGSFIIYEAIKVIFSVNSTFGKDIPVTKDIHKE